MKLEQLSPQVSVSEQIQPQDLPALADLGVTLVVCNRPDGEAADQPSFASIERAASASGIKAVNIPFVASEFNAGHVAAFRELLATGERIHAYCRTGNRSSVLWRASQA